MSRYTDFIADNRGTEEADCLRAEREETETTPGLRMPNMAAVSAMTVPQVPHLEAQEEDRETVHQSADSPDARDIMQYLPGTGQWAVADMDDGMLRLESSYRAARAWCLRHSEGRVLRRHSHGRGHYDLVIGIPGEDRVDFFTVIRADLLTRHGWDPYQTPLYPYISDPHEEYMRREGTGAERESDQADEPDEAALSEVLSGPTWDEIVRNDESLAEGRAITHQGVTLGSEPSVAVDANVRAVVSALVAAGHTPAPLTGEYDDETCTATGFMVHPIGDGLVYVYHLENGQMYQPEGREWWTAELSAYRVTLNGTGWHTYRPSACLRVERPAKDAAPSFPKRTPGTHHSR